MDVWETLRIVLRRWTVSVPLAVLTIVAVVAIPSDVGQEYTSDASLVFLPPNTQEFQTEDGFTALENSNSFLDQSGPVAAMAELIEISLTSASVRALVEAEGLEPEYELEVGNGSPIMGITVTAGSPALATGTVDYVLGLIDRDLTERQDLVEAPPAERIGTQIISDTSPALASAGAATRLRLIILVVGLAFAVGAALLVEGAAGWAARRRAEGWGGGGGQDANHVGPDAPAPGGAAAPAPVEPVAAPVVEPVVEASPVEAPEPVVEAEPERVPVEASEQVVEAEPVVEASPVEASEPVEAEPERVSVDAVADAAEAADESAPEPTDDEAAAVEAASSAPQPAKPAGSGRQRSNKRKPRRPMSNQGGSANSRNAGNGNATNRNGNAAKTTNRTAKNGGQGQAESADAADTEPVEATADRKS